MNWFSYFSLCAVFLILSANTCQREEDCPDDIMCTMIFTSISVEVIDADDNPISLSNTQVTSQHLDAPLDSLPETPEQGQYTIVSDSHMPYLSHIQPRTFHFKGWLDGDLVVDEMYLIRHDCCHVELLDGPTTIVLE